MKNTEKTHLKQALDQARIQQGFCAPNPSVGAVVVKAGEILAKGYHRGPGTLHAEPAALNQLNDETIKGSTVYVTLEPCGTFGRTPPCTDLLIRKGVHKVVFGHYDPNPAVAGKGIVALAAAGILCEHLPLAEIEDFYRAYTYWHQKKLPWVTTKLAMSLDGKIALTNTAPTQISSDRLQRYTHQKRKEADALLSTAKTIMADNSQLNARLEGEVYAKPLYLLDRRLSIPLTAKIFSTAKTLTIFYQEGAAPQDKLAALTGRGVCCVASDLQWPTILPYIAAKGSHTLWVEAGSRCFESLTQSGYLCEAIFYITPKILGPEAYPAFLQGACLEDFRKVKWKIMGDEMVGHFSK